jgi:hypothetical protein
MQVRKKDTQRIYALKPIRKAHISQRPVGITHMLAEHTVMALVNNPYIVPQVFIPESRLSVCYFYYFRKFEKIMTRILSQSIAENCFATCNEREVLINGGVDSTQQNRGFIYSL